MSFTVKRGETLGIVGESGCGKSTLARCLLRLLDPTSGRIVFDGRDITSISRREMRPIRRELMMVFQDPYASLNARKRVGFIVAEPLEVNKLGTPAERKRRVQELLEVVGLNPEHYNRFPHEFSGGQRQRIGVARALAVNPKLIVCDEPVLCARRLRTGSDPEPLKDLQREFGLTYVFIAHDLNVVRHISNRVMVMYLGKIVEEASDSDLYTPYHPYTGALLSAVPVPNPELGRKRRPIILEGDVPNPIDPPPGCHFHPRCPNAIDGTCDVIEPPLVEVAPGSEGHVTTRSRASGRLRRRSASRIPQPRSGDRRRRAPLRGSLSPHVGTGSVAVGSLIARSGRSARRGAAVSSVRRGCVLRGDRRGSRAFRNPLQRGARADWPLQGRRRGSIVSSPAS